MLSRLGKQCGVKRLFSCCPSGSQAIYEVSIGFHDSSIREEYYNWLSGRHVREVLNVDGFLSAEILNEYKGNGLVVRYTIESTDVFERYNASEQAVRLRQEALGKFGPKSFSATRRVLIVSDMIYK
jgi:hypothetical protein